MQVVLVRFFFISILYNRQWCTSEYGCQRKGLQHSCCTPLDFVLLIFRSFMNAYKRVLKLNIYSPLSYLNNRFFIFETISFYSFKFLKRILYSFRKNWIELKVPFWFNLDFDMRLRLLVTKMLLDSDLDSKDMKY